MSGDAYARRSDPETSHEAAYSVDANSLELLAYKMIDSTGIEGVTGERLSFITGIDKNTICPRIAPLVRKGFIVDSGRRRYNETGKRAIVWVSRRFFVEEEDMPTFAELHEMIKCEL